VDVEELLSRQLFSSRLKIAVQRSRVAEPAEPRSCVISPITDWCYFNTPVLLTIGGHNAARTECIMVCVSVPHTICNVMCMCGYGPRDLDMGMFVIGIGRVRWSQG
jgi:hypothetical protein